MNEKATNVSLCIAVCAFTKTKCVTKKGLVNLHLCLAFLNQISQTWEADVLGGKILSCSKIGIFTALLHLGKKKKWAEGEARVRKVYQQDMVVFPHFVVLKMEI